MGRVRCVYMVCVSTDLQSSATWRLPDIRCDSIEKLDSEWGDPATDCSAWQLLTLITARSALALVDAVIITTLCS